MAVDSKNVFVGAPDQLTTGAILTGPETDVIPAGIDDLVFSSLTESGFISESGVEVTPTESTQNIKDWSLKTIRKIMTEFDSTLTWTHIELNPASAANYFGDNNVTTKAATSTKGKQMRLAISGDARPVKAWYFKIKDGARRVVIFVPHGQVTERGAIPVNASTPISLPVTLSTYPDAAGKNVYIYTDDGVVSA